MTKAWQLVQHGWCQGEYAKNAQGEMVNHMAPEAVQWCTLGALRRVYGGDAVEQDIEFERVIGTPPLIWNDDAERTQAEVVEALKKANL